MTPARLQHLAAQLLALHTLGRHPPPVPSSPHKGTSGLGGAVADPVQPLRPPILAQTWAAWPSPNSKSTSDPPSLLRWPVSRLCTRASALTPPTSAGRHHVGLRGPVPGTSGAPRASEPGQAPTCVARPLLAPPLLPPPPGDYFPEKSTKHIFDSAPSHSISARTKTFRVDSTPGPGQSRQPPADAVGPRVGVVRQGSLPAGGSKPQGRKQQRSRVRTTVQPEAQCPCITQVLEPTCCPW